LKPIKPLNIFYEEPDPDRWLPFDRYLRKVIRRIYRGKPIPGGQFMVFSNLIKGLDKLNIPYRLNNYRHIEKNPAEVACIIGKDQVLFEREWQNPIIFGPAFGINPVQNPDILNQYPTIKQLVVPGQWLKNMFLAYQDKNISVWPVGIDTEKWQPAISVKTVDFLIYNKIRWEHSKMNVELVNPIKACLQANNLTYTEIKYGHYKPAQLQKKLAQCKYAIFICEHETQGIAYQQILAAGLPILAWDRGGYWQDSSWYPHAIKFQPVSSVPYWDTRCGTKFISINEFEAKLNEFLNTAKSGTFDPRAYIMDNLTLEKCATKYVDIVNSVING
jgi:hypothetical protein